MNTIHHSNSNQLAMGNNLKIAVDTESLVTNISKIAAEVKESKLAPSEKEAVKLEIQKMIEQLESLKHKLSEQ